MPATSKTSLVGIINVTPDSFSDGGLHNSPDAALDQARRMVKEGASVIDIGAESTRPGAKTISPEEEWKRLGPVLEKLRESELNAWISVDTRNPETAAKALLAGIDWLNDPSGLANPKMLEEARKSAVNVVIMHNLGIPADPNKVMPEKEDIIVSIVSWAAMKIDELTKQGIGMDRIIFDPGIGFGKTAEQSYTIIENIEAFKKLGVRLMVGHSRKSFLKAFTDEPAHERDEITAKFSSWLANLDVDYLRVHDIKTNKKALRKRKNTPTLPKAKAGTI